LSPRILAVVYVVIGLGCAVPEFVRISRLRTRGARIALVASALLTVILWPLWAPFALAPRRPSKRRPERQETELNG
jgi:hypothetical protein